MRPLFILLTAICILSCKKDADKKNKAFSLVDCYDNFQNLDTTLLEPRLSGSWKLSAQACWMDSELEDDVRLSFNTGRTYEIKKNGATIAQGTWQFREWGGAWSIKVSQENFYVFGQVMFCNNKLVFSGQPLDGCDHYFTKN